VSDVPVLQLDDAAIRADVFEQKLTVSMRGMGRAITERPEIVRALAAAESLQEGYTVADDAQAAELADLQATVIDGIDALEEQIRLALRIPKAMEAALRGSVLTAKEGLAKAKEVGNRARVAYQNTLRRRAAEAEEKARQEAALAAQRAAEEAALTGDDAPPPVQIAPIEVPRTLAGGTGKMGTQTRVEPVEIVSFSDCPAEWLTLALPVVRAAFTADVLARKVQKPAPGESIVYRGVRFESREFAVNRRA
jgi:hypothetical protein